MRGARAMLPMWQADFADTVGVTVGALRKAERSSGEVRDVEDFPRKVTQGLARLGVELISTGFYAGNGGPGLRLNARASIGLVCSSQHGRFRFRSPIRHPFGVEKKRLAQDLAAEIGVSSDQVIANADSFYDTELLRWAGTSVAVRPGPRLADIAQSEGWKVLGRRQGSPPG